MRFSTLSLEGRSIVAAVSGDVYYDLTAYNPAVYRSMRSMLADSPSAVARAQEDAQRAPRVDLGRAKFLPPVPDATKVLCVGRNYAQHAQEQGAEVPREPLIFAKAPSALAAHNQAVRLPTLSDQVDYEAELVVVIGKRATQVPRDRAMQHVAGYCCGNDITARDWQKEKPGQQWLLGKSFDTFGPVGPQLVTVDEIPDPSELLVEMSLNGEVVQSASTLQMVFPVDFLITYISQVMTLEPGDLLFTGTPSGVGAAKDPPVFLKPGDLMEVEINGVGRLANRVE